MITQGLNRIGGLIARGLNALIGGTPLVDAVPHPARTAVALADTREWDARAEYRAVVALADARVCDVPASALAIGAWVAVVAESRNADAAADVRACLAPTRGDAADVPNDGRVCAVPNEARGANVPHAPITATPPARGEEVDA